MAGRLGIKLPLEKFDEISRKVPLLATCVLRASI
jgi:dihydroxyacid dehydratase/phosphogluconate dehydratase